MSWSQDIEPMYTKDRVYKLAHLTKLVKRISQVLGTVYARNKTYVAGRRQNPEPGIIPEKKGWRWRESAAILGMVGRALGGDRI